MRIYTQINGLESIKLGIPAGCDIIWQKPNINRFHVYWEYPSFDQSTDMQKYHNFWRPVNFADMLEQPQLLELQKNLCYKAIFKTIPNPSP